MKKKFGLFLLPSVMLTLGVVGGIKFASQPQEDRDAKIIVQLKRSVNNQSYENVILEQNEVLSYIRSAVSSNIKVNDRFTSLLNGFSLEINSKYVDQVRHIPGVKDVSYDEVIATNAIDADDMERIKAQEVKALEANISAATMNVPDGTKKGEGVVVAVIDDGFLINAEYTDTDGKVKTVTHAAYTALGANVATPLTQESIKAIVDSTPGFHGKYDSKHSTYLNTKVPFYYDYGGDDSSRQEDYDVFYASSSHGTHTSSTAGGNDPNYPGIAPNCQLVLMKGATTQANSNGFATSCVVKALEDCAALNVDVVSMSFGSALVEFNHENIAVQAIKALRDKGVLVNAAAGNEGKGTYNGTAYESWSTDIVESGILGSTTSHDNIMSIASGEPDKLFVDTALVVGGRNIPFYDQITDYKSTSGDVTYKVQRHMTDLLKLPGHSDGNFEWVKVAGLGKLSDYDDASMKNVSVSGKIAVIDRGDITFKEKIQNAQTKGAIAVAIIDNDFSATEFNFRMALQNDDGSTWTPDVPVCSLLNRNRVNFGEAGTASTCSILNNVVIGNPDSDTMSSFSSDGALATLAIKPEITAPGTSILGAVYDAQNPSSNCSYDYYSGTSMATPNFSGACAIMLSEHLGDAAYAKTIDARLMSAAEPLVDRYGTNFDSVRRQGAGMVDVKAALDSKVYFDGTTDASKPSGYAKVELKNNDDIKKGDIKLNFTAYSEEASNVTYKAKVYVYRPKVANALSADNYGERLGNAKLIATYDELVTTVEKDVVVTPGSNAIALTASLSDTVKAEINSIFEFGCAIEGYAVFTAEGKETISLPYLGFYGDYSAAYPVEPFSFEKDPNKVYTSELLETLCARSFSKDKAQFSSNMVTGYWANLGDVQTALFNTNSPYINNEARLTEINDGANKPVVEAGTDPYTKQHGDTIYLSNGGGANTIVVSQFVTRTVKTNTITLKNKANGQVALSTHLYDTFYGATYDNTREVAWPLYKSFFDVNYYDSYMAHRARAIIPTYSYTYNAVNGKYTVGNPLPEGEYTLTFHYELMAGTVYEKTYNVVIDNAAPEIISMVKSADGQSLRIYYKEANASYVTISGTPYELKKDDKGYYVDVPVSERTPKNFVKCYDKANASSNAIVHATDEYSITVSSASFISTHDFKSNVVVENGSYTLTFEWLKNNKTTTFSDTITVAMILPDVTDLAITETTIKGKENEVKFIVDGNCVIFSGDSRSTFVLKVKDNGQGGGNSGDSKGGNGSSTGCGGSIVASSAILSFFALGAFSLLFAKRKKED